MCTRYTLHHLLIDLNCPFPNEVFTMAPDCSFSLWAFNDLSDQPRRLLGSCDLLTSVKFAGMIILLSLVWEGGSF